MMGSAPWQGSPIGMVLTEEPMWCWLLTPWDSLNRNGLVAAAEAQVERAVVARAGPEAAGLEVKAAQEEQAVPVAPAEQVALGEQEAKGAPEAQAPPEARAAEPPVELGAESQTRTRTILIAFLRSREQSFRNFRHQRQQISKSLQRLRMERAGSRSSTRTTCWAGLRRSGASRASSISWATCRNRRLRGVATR